MSNQQCNISHLLLLCSHDSSSLIYEHTMVPPALEGREEEKYRNNWLQTGSRNFQPPSVHVDTFPNSRSNRTSQDVQRLVYGGVGRLALHLQRRG